MNIDVQHSELYNILDYLSSGHKTKERAFIEIVNLFSEKQCKKFDDLNDCEKHRFDNSTCDDCEFLTYKNNTMKERTVETFAMRNYKTGDVFYSHKQDKHLTAISAHEGVKIKTERMVAIDSEKHSRIEFITKITIL